MCREARGREAAGYRLDVADRARIQALAAQVAADHGDVDIVVNNAGVGMVGRSTEVTADQWEWIRSINLDGVINGCAVFAPGKPARGRGHIVNVSSGLAYMYVRTQPAYITTKAAVLTLSSGRLSTTDRWFRSGTRRGWAGGSTATYRSAPIRRSASYP